MQQKAPKPATIGRVGRQIVIPYRPRAQFLPYHERAQRWAAIVAHRRAGKTVACINDDIRDCLRSAHWRTGEPVEGFRAAYIAPLHKQAKSVAWDYVRHYAAVVPGVKFNEAELRADFPNGSRLRLWGADNYDAIRGIYLDKATLDEPADMDPRAWAEVIRPALADRQGRATFIGTPKGKNSFWEQHERARVDPDWYSLVLKASETGILSSAELVDAAKEMSPDQFRQEFECAFDAALVGAYYGVEMREAEEQGRICSVPYDPGALVHTAWDLGIDDATAIWFVQIVGREYHVIDFYESSDRPLAHYAALVREKPYKYAAHYLPHDARARELQTGKSREQYLRELGLVAEVGAASAVADGVEAVRRLIPQMWFDAVKCGRGLEALRQYRREFDAKMNTFRPKPLHDWTSHAADALREFAMAYAPKAPAANLMRLLSVGSHANTGWMGS